MSKTPRVDAAFERCAESIISGNGGNLVGLREEMRAIEIELNEKSRRPARTRHGIAAKACSALFKKLETERATSSNLRKIVRNAYLQQLGKLPAEEQCDLGRDLATYGRRNA